MPEFAAVVVLSGFTTLHAWIFRSAKQPLVGPQSEYAFDASLQLGSVNIWMQRRASTTEADNILPYDVACCSVWQSEYVVVPQSDLAPESG